MLFKPFLIFSFTFAIISCNNNLKLLTQDIVKELIDCDSLKIPCPELCKGLSNGKLWAIKMLDAMSKLPSGLLQGNLMDYGNYDECLEIDDKVDNVKGKHCTFSLIILFDANALKGYNIEISNKTNYLPGTDLQQSMEFGTRELTASSESAIPLILSMCLPSTCSPSDFEASAQKVRSRLGFVSFTFQDTTCKTNELPDIDNYDIVVITIFSIIILCVILCTTYDTVMYKMERIPAHPILIAFSFFTNGKKLITITNNPDQLLCLNGLRFISMMWVVAGHKYLSIQMLPVVNKVFVERWKHKVYSQYIMGAPLAVDTFLCLSGIVLSYTFLKVQRKPKAKFNIILFYVHRYLRLTPAVAGLFLITISLIKYIGDGPLASSIVNLNKDNCLNYWWSYFLYVQNYVNMKEVCWAHTWYLSMDMQMFLISPLILWPLLKCKKYALYALYAAVIVFIIVPFVITYQYETVMFSQDYSDYYYYATHTRIAPWIIGLILGVYILDTKSEEFKIRWSVNLLIWFVVLCGMGAIVFTGNDIINNYERVKNAIYISVHRSAWCVGVCWIVYASVKGRGGIIGWFLSLPMFQVLARLTYSMYIIHLVVLLVIMGRYKTAQYLSDFDLFYGFCGDLTLTLISATIWCLIFESPMIIVEKCIFGGASSKKQITGSTKELTPAESQSIEKV